MLLKLKLWIARSVAMYGNGITVTLSHLSLSLGGMHVSILNKIPKKSLSQPYHFSYAAFLQLYNSPRQVNNICSA